MKYIVAMSGGVDSSVAAAIAKRAGHEVIGVTLRMKHPDPEFSSAQLCASKSDEEAVLSVCAALGIEHRFYDRFPEFADRILRPAAEEYLNGRTPNPCCMCNERVKFATLFDAMREYDADGVITGHYARIDRSGGRARLRRGSDPAKDQTYFLYRLTPEMLEKIWFPVGEMEKSEVRKIAEELGLSTAKKPDSQDACFQVPGECFGETLRRLFELPPKRGRFVYRGKTVGTHNGVHQYTIGQRKGLNVALGVPGYVAGIDARSGDVLLETDQNALMCESFDVEDLAGAPFPSELLVQVRYRSKAVPARCEMLPDGHCRVTLETPQRAVTPGQAAVFYDADFLLGGGVIGETRRDTE